MSLEHRNSKDATKKSALSLTERLGLVGYRNQNRSEIKPHIVVDTDICNSSCLTNVQRGYAG